MAVRPSIHLGPAAVVDDWQGPAWLASGHRAFFLASGLYGALAIVLWLLAWRGLLPLSSPWHGHEMVFGFGVAAIAGFLQAAVPKWTQQPIYRGRRVALLLALWLAGRLGMALPGLHFLDLLFLPVLAWLIGTDLVRSRNRRNYIVIAVLAGLWGIDLLYHFGPASLALRVAIYVVVALIALIGGRIVPMFTRNAMRLDGHFEFDCGTPRWLEVAAVPTVLGVAVTELVLPSSVWSGAVAGVAAVVLGWSLRGWHPWQTRRLPLVWILHVGYGFLPFGFALKAVADLGGPVGPFAALHALTAGGIGVMILGVSSRAALGHSGLPLQPSRATVVAYGLVITGALLRVLTAHPHALLAAGILWSSGFALFAKEYWPILTRPRTDGLPG